MDKIKISLPKFKTSTLLNDQQIRYWNNLSPDEAISKGIEDQEEPMVRHRVIDIVIIFYWLTGLTNVLNLIVGGSLIFQINQIQKTNLAGALDYNFVKAMPYLPVLSFLGILGSVMYFWAAIKLLSGSKKAWITAIIFLVGALVLSLLNDALLTKAAWDFKALNIVF